MPKTIKRTIISTEELKEILERKYNFKIHTMKLSRFGASCILHDENHSRGF